MDRGAIEAAFDLGFPYGEQLSSGTYKTYLFAVQHHKPHLVIVKGEIAKVQEWLKKVAADLGKESLVLNVAGPRESKCRGIQKTTRAFVRKLITMSNGRDGRCLSERTGVSVLRR